MHFVLADTEQGPSEKRLLRHLFEELSYNKLERPVANESLPLVVHFGLVLQQIIDVVKYTSVLLVLVKYLLITVCTSTR